MGIRGIGLKDKAVVSMAWELLGIQQILEVAVGYIDGTSCKVKGSLIVARMLRYRAR